MPQITSFKQIKDIIEPIPANLFQIYCYGHCEGGDFGENTGETDNGMSCFFGHINRHFNPSTSRASDDANAYGARQLTRKFLIEVHSISCDGADVNNRTDINGYNQPEIKDRVMAMIEDGIKWEENKSLISS